MGQKQKISLVYTDECSKAYYLIYKTVPKLGAFVYTLQQGTLPGIIYCSET